MTNSKFILRALRGAVAAALVGVALGAAAQGVKPPAPLRFPAGLKWQPMNIGTLIPTSAYFYNATTQETDLLKKIWAKELEARKSIADPIPVSPDFVIGALPKNQGTTSYVFSIMTRDLSLPDVCYPAPNGTAGIDHEYWTCPLRVSVFLGDGGYKYKDFPDYYCITGGAPNESRWGKNHNEFAYDPRNGIVYFRVLQSGKVAPDCNRAIRIGKV